MTGLQEDSELQHLLAEIPAGANGAHAELICRTILDICRQDVPGNVIMLPPGNFETATILAGVISRHTRQMRMLFLPDSVFAEHSAELARYGGGIGIRSLSGLLTEKHNARNWLGKIAFVHAGEQTGEAQLLSCIELLEGQLSDHAVVMPASASETLCKQTGGAGRDTAWQLENGMRILRYRRKAVANTAIPADLVEEFRQDDPAGIGIFTLMSDNERFQLYYIARRCLPANSLLVRFVEIGSFQGGSFYEICRALQRQKLPFQGISIEPELGSRLKHVLQQFVGSAVHLRMMSHEAVRMLAGYLKGSMLPELILIDGDHSYEGVCCDIRNYYPMLAPGGIMLLHDYLPPCKEENREFIRERTGGNPGVGEACREILEERFGLAPLELPLLYPEDPVQTMACQPIIPGVFSTLRAYRKPLEKGVESNGC